MHCFGCLSSLYGVVAGIIRPVERFDKGRRTEDGEHLSSVLRLLRNSSDQNCGGRHYACVSARPRKAAAVAALAGKNDSITSLV